MTLSISTAWNFKEDKDVRQLLTEIKDLGLNAIELGYRLKPAYLKALTGLLDEFDMNVSSIHNFCPLPDDEPSPRHASNYYRLSSLDDEERKKAVVWTKNSIDTAEQVNADVVVIHAGTIELDDDPTKKILEMVRQDQAGTNEFFELREQLLDAREHIVKPYLDAVTKSLKDVCAYGQTKNVKIGLETRYYPIEIPNFEEIEFFLEQFHSEGLYYWHDFGHAEVSGRVGITPHIDFLKTYKDRMIGVHIHGVQSTKDHLAPFQGDFKLEDLLSFLDEKTIKVIESHSSATSEDIKVAIKKLK